MTTTNMMMMMMMMMMTILLLMLMSLWLQPAVLSELEGVVLLDADVNHVSSCYDDASILPTKLVCH